MRFRWILEPQQPLAAAELAQALKIPPLLAQCLLNRELKAPADISAFLQPRLKHLADPFLLPNMSAAVERLFCARERGEALIIFGDYDVDGVTSTALLVEVLRRLGWIANWYLPNRLDEGYGLSRDALENCLGRFPATLLLAVDCGSTSAEAIAWLRQRGVDVIVLDHHQVSDPPPAATALVNPHLGSGDSAQPSFRELCSAGLAFKLAHALVKRGREAGLPGAAEFDLRPLLDLVALGTVADLVPLRGENRILVTAGLERLAATTRPGLLALKQIARCPEPVGTYEVGFQLAPRLNAAGRLETAAEALHLLLASDPAQALPIARKLDAQNRERQQIERAIADEAIARIKARFNPAGDFIIVEGHEAWHVGVVGIVASRVLQQFYRPTIIVGGDGTEWRGSGRSIAGFDLAAALRECGHLLLRHGGHAMAAGLSLQPANLEAFRAHLNEIGRRHLKSDLLQAPLRLDAEITLSDVSLECLGQLAQLKPNGQGNPAVQFCVSNVTHQRPPQRIGSDKQHVKMWLTDGRTTHETLWWNAGSQSLPLGRFDLAFTPQVNEFNGRRAVQLKLLDWRPLGSSPAAESAIPQVHMP